MGDSCPQLLDLIPRNKEWISKKDEHGRHGFSSEEKKLELRLAPPGEEYWSTNGGININCPKNRDESLLSLGYFNGGKRGFMETSNNNGCQHQKFCSYFHQESSQTCSTKVVDLQNAEKKPFSPSSANTAVPNTSQKRTAPAPVVGWPPIRSFRKNLASSSSLKPISESQTEVPNKVPNTTQVENFTKGLLVKINMDGVPIGRKVDLKAYDSYDNLSIGVDKLFRGLLAAQRDSSINGVAQNILEEGKAITGLLDGSGEYTLVYEDNEGDRMLVGDVPWHMFVTTVKRLRVLKSSELSALNLGTSKGR